MLVDQREIDHIVQHLIYQFELVYPVFCQQWKIVLDGIQSQVSSARLIASKILSFQLTEEVGFALYRPW